MTKNKKINLKIKYVASANHGTCNFSCEKGTTEECVSYFLNCNGQIFPKEKQAINVKQLQHISGEEIKEEK